MSVIVPVHNGERFLRDAVESVLRQGYRPLEIIIVDDGSTDGTAAVARSFGDPVRYFRQEKAGPAAARNLGIQNARGSVIAFIDADDVWPDEKLALQLRCLETWPAVDVVQGLIRRIHVSDPPPHGAAAQPIDLTFVHTNLGSMVMRRSVFEILGGFDENLRFHEDTDFWLRAMEADLRVLVQRRLALIYRIHGSNITSGEDARTMGLASIVRRSLHRRRSPSGHVPSIGRLTYMPEMGSARPGETGRTAGPQTWPLISIVAYGAADSVTARRAVDSIRIQEYKPLEIVIVGKALSPDVLTAEDQFERVVRVDAHADMASGLNAAIRRARGELVTFLDVAGAWTPGKLRSQAAYLLERPADAYVAGRTRHIINPSLVYAPGLIVAISMKKSMGDLLPTLMVRRQALAVVGEFASALDGMEDTDWILRAHDLGFAKCVLPFAMFLRYVEPHSNVAGYERMRAALLESVRSSVKRKRNAGVPRT